MNSFKPSFYFSSTTSNKELLCRCLTGCWVIGLKKAANDLDFLIFMQEAQEALSNYQPTQLM